MNFGLVVGFLCLGAFAEGHARNFKRDVNGWTCAQQCFAANSTEQEEAVSRRLKRQTEEAEAKVDAMLQSYQSFCGALNDERFTCAAQCPMTNLTQKLRDEVSDMKNSVCKDVGAWEDEFKCAVNGSSTIKSCVVTNCRKPILEIASILLDNLASDDSEMVIPGDKFCAVESCIQDCLKKDLVPRCGVEVYEIFEKMQSIEDDLLTLMSLDKEPQTGEKCFDIPMTIASNDVDFD
uniref:Uncharacterized protein n=1 Tax=Acrobeloides nanus TaxID=290746 RepID=A0A914C4T3_9BILA